MVLEVIFDLIQAAIFGMFSWLDVPDLPSEITNGISEFFALLQYGSGFIGFFLPARLISPFFVIFLLIYVVDTGYPFIMWIVRKIPVSID